MLLVLARAGIGADHEHVPDRIPEPWIDVVLGEPGTDDPPALTVIHEKNDVLVVDDDNAGSPHVLNFLGEQLT